MQYLTHPGLAWALGAASSGSAATAVLSAEPLWGVAVVACFVTTTTYFVNYSRWSRQLTQAEEHAARKRLIEQIGNQAKIIDDVGGAPRVFDFQYVAGNVIVVQTIQSLTLTHSCGGAPPRMPD